MPYTILLLTIAAIVAYAVWAEVVAYGEQRARL